MLIVCYYVNSVVSVVSVGLQAAQHQHGFGQPYFALIQLQPNTMSPTFPTVEGQVISSTIRLFLFEEMRTATV